MAEFITIDNRPVLVLKPEDRSQFVIDALKLIELIVDAWFRFETHGYMGSLTNTTVQKREFFRHRKIPVIRILRGHFGTTDKPYPLKDAKDLVDLYEQGLTISAEVG
jgi:ribosomal protein L7/L12